MHTDKRWGLLGRGVASLTLAAALAACAGSSDASSGNSEAAAAAPAPSSSVTPTGAFGIQVKGNQFVSAKDGSPVQIVGTQFSGLETGYSSRWPQYSNAGAAFWSTLLNYRGSGLNTVRFPLNEASWLNYTCYDSGTGASGKLYSSAIGRGYTPDPNKIYQATVKKAVADATAAGLYVILVDFWGAPNNDTGRPLCPIGQPGFANADHSFAFWKSVADAFKGNPAVMFELFNEPFGNNVYTQWVVQSGSSTYTPGTDAITLRDGGAYSPFRTQNNTAGNAEVAVNETWQVAGMQDMLKTIRGEGATNVVLSAPIGWAGEIETWLGSQPSDPLGQLAVAWHVYGYRKGQDPPRRVLAAGYPILITETYGLDAIGGYKWAASQGIGYAWCCWNDWGSQSSLAVAIASEGPPWFMGTAP
jgi:endoglucanase